MKKNLPMLSLLGALLAPTPSAFADLIATVYEDWQRDGVRRGGTGDITFAGLTELGSFIDPNIDHWNGSHGHRWMPFGRDDFYSVRWVGHLNVATAGEYSFRTTSDDGVQLLLGGAKIIDWPELQWYGVATGVATLGAGLTPIEVRFYENTIHDGIRLEWMRPGENEWSIVPAEMLTPVPEPETWALLLAGLGVLAWKTRTTISSEARRAS